MNKLFFFFASLVSLLNISTVHSQNVLNKYKYVLVSDQFNFQNEPHQYNINHIIKSSLNQRGFEAFVKGEKISKDIDAASILRISIYKSELLSTKMSITFNDYSGQEVYTSIKGKSLIKKYPGNFYEALKIALNDENIKNHKYTTTDKPAVKKTSL